MRKRIVIAFAILMAWCVPAVKAQSLKDSVRKYSDIYDYYYTFGAMTDKMIWWERYSYWREKQDSLESDNRKRERENAKQSLKKELETKYKIKLK